MPIINKKYLFFYEKSFDKMKLHIREQLMFIMGEREGYES